MSDLFLTNPDSPKSHLLTKKANVSWDHKERTVAALIEMGVPLRCAELAVIDFRGGLYSAQKRRLSPHQTAQLLFQACEPIYTNKDGSWHYAQNN